MFNNPPLDAICSMLQSLRTIAVVGLSPHPYRPSNRIARLLQANGYRIIPVRPVVTEVLGEKAYARLADIPEAIDLVNVFRSPEHVAGIVDDCLALGLGRIWLQDGVVCPASAERAKRAGMTVVMDRCIGRDLVACE